MLKAGKYYVGDPCYVFAYDKWDEVLEKTNFFEDDSVFEFMGFEFFVGHTAYGDGEYTDNYGKRYSVDAGLIGCLPIEMVEVVSKANTPENKTSDSSISALKRLGRIIDFDSDFECKEINGYFIIGDIRIQTGEYTALESIQESGDILNEGKITELYDDDWKKIDSKKTREDKLRLVYQWVKNDHISFKVFFEIMDDIIDRGAKR